MHGKQVVLLSTMICICFCCSFVSIAKALDLSKITVDGDFRYRHEYFDVEDEDQFSRHQLRARLRLVSTVVDDINFIIQIASGEGNAPFSTDQTLTGSFSSKHLWLDKAYAEWKPACYQGLALTAGKAPNPFYRANNNQLLWNPDVFVEGLSVKYDGSGSAVNIFAVASSYWMEQRAAGDDSWLYAAQAGINYSTSGITFTGGATYYTYTNTKGNPAFWDAGNSFGNSVDTLGNYLNDYNLLEIFAKVSFEKTVIPFSAYVDYVTNSGADENNQAYLGGVTAGKLDKTLAWALTYEYRQIETDALIGMLNDPDFAGGLTDSKGHKFNIALRLANKIVTDLTYIYSTKGIDNGKYYRRAQLALNLAL